MVRNSFKFLTLALAAVITVAPVLAIDLNSNSTRLGLAVVGIACVAAYKYFFGTKEDPKQEKKQVVIPVVATVEEKQELFDILRYNKFYIEDYIFIYKTIDKLDDRPKKIIQEFLKVRKDLLQKKANNEFKKFVPNNKQELAKENSLRENLQTLYTLIGYELEVVPLDG